MLKTVLMVFIVLGGLIYISRPHHVPSTSLPVFLTGSPVGVRNVGGACPKSRCLLIYVAPWCPSCKQLNITMVALRDELEAEGVQVDFVIGMDKMPKLQAYSAGYNKTVMLDDQGFHKKAKIKAVPYFAVVNRRGNVENSMYSGYDDVSAMRTKLGI